MAGSCLHLTQHFWVSTSSRVQAYTLCCSVAHGSLQHFLQHAFRAVMMCTRIALQFACTEHRLQGMVAWHDDKGTCKVWFAEPRVQKCVCACMQVGTKLLWFDVKIASRLALKSARGKELSRCVGGWCLMQSCTCLDSTS